MNKLLRFFCERFKHPIAKWSMDVSGEFVVSDCTLCKTVIIQSMIEDHEQDDYERVLDRWFVDWKHDE